MHSYMATSNASKTWVLRAAGHGIAWVVVVRCDNHWSHRKAWGSTSTLRGRAAFAQQGNQLMKAIVLSM